MKKVLRLTISAACLALTMNLTSCAAGDTIKAIKNIVMSDENSVGFDDEKISKDNASHNEFLDKKIKYVM